MLYPVDLPRRTSLEDRAGRIRAVAPSTARHFAVAIRRAALAVSLPAALIVGAAVPASSSIAVETAPITASVARATTSSGSLQLGAPRVTAPSVGTVTTSVLNMRTGPSTGYAVITTLGYGTQGTVLGQSNGWYNIQTNRGTGWVSGMYFSVGAAAPTAPAPAPASGTGYVTTSALNLRTGPGTGYGVITVLGYGTRGTIVGQSNGWYNVQTNLGTGWVSGAYFSVGGAPAAPAPAPTPAPPAPAPAPASNVAAIAWQYVGYPYVYGAAGPGAFDCSGFTQYVYARAGMSITRTTYTQWNTPGTRIGSYGGLQPGDLMFFANTYGSGITHVGIFVGGSQMIHAGTPATGVEVTNIYDPFWTSHFAGGIRPYR